MNFHAVEETLHHDDALPPSRAGAMHVEKDLRFGKSRWDAVPRLRLIYRPAAIGDQFSISIVDRNDQSPMHQSWSRVETNAKLDCCLFGNPALGQIGMRAIDASQLESQGW